MTQRRKSLEHDTVLVAKLEQLPFWEIGMGFDVNDRRPEPGARYPHGHRVYALDGGHVIDERAGARACLNRRIEVGHFSYWHVDPVVRVGQKVGAGQLIGWTCKNDYHVHVSEWQVLAGRRIWVSPLHRDGKLEPYTNTAVPEVTDIRFTAPAPKPWLHWSDPDTARPLAVAALHGLVEVRARVDDDVTFLGFLHFDRKLAAPDPPYRLGIEIRNAAGRVVLRRISFQADYLPPVPWYVHFAPPTKPDLSVEECLLVPVTGPCAPPHWYRPLSRSRVEYWDTRRVPNGRYVVVVVAWDNRDDVGVRRTPVVVAN